MIPKVSVIIPVYQADEKAFMECCDSIVLQNEKSYEVIVVDDSGSSDKNTFVVSCCKENGFKLIRNARNHGVSYSRNVAMREARGEYLAFIDADDCVYSDYLSDAVAIADETGADCVIGKMLLTDMTEKLPERATLNSSYRLYEKNELPLVMRGVIEGNDFTSKAVIKAKSLVPAGPCGRLYRRSSVADARFDETLTLGEDIVFNLDVLAQSRRCAVSDKVWYQYKQNPESASHSIDEAGVSAQLRLCHALIANHTVSEQGITQSVLARILGSLKCILNRGVIVASLRETLTKASEVKRILADEAILRAASEFDDRSFRIGLADKVFLLLVRRRRIYSLLIIFWLNSVRKPF